MSDLIPVPALLPGQIRGKANLPEHYATRRLIEPSFGKREGLIRKVSDDELEEYEEDVEEVAPSADTPEDDRVRYDKVKYRTKTYRRKSAISAEDAESATVLIDSTAPAEVQAILAEQQLAATRTIAADMAKLYTKLEAAHEIAAGEVMGDTTLWHTNSEVLAGASQWSHSDSDPVARIEKAVADTYCTAIAFSYEAWVALSFNAKVKAARTTNVDSHNVTLEWFRAFAMDRWGITKVEVSRARYKRGGVYQYAWDNWVHFASPAEREVPVGGGDFAVNQQSIIRVVRPRVPRPGMTRMLRGAAGAENDGYLVDMWLDVDKDTHYCRLTREDTLVVVQPDRGLTLAEVSA